ncbi:MAG: hypothetical protein HGA19_24925 [Oscillochloris sp.]|nr:hypothetical protein [Oscillochloris sp.]
MEEGERSWPEDRRTEEQGSSRHTDDTGLAGWLRRTLTPRPREVWVMEPDGTLRKVVTEDT